MSDEDPDSTLPEPPAPEPEPKPAYPPLELDKFKESDLGGAQHSLDDE